MSANTARKEGWSFMRASRGGSDAGLAVALEKMAKGEAFEMPAGAEAGQART